MTKGEAIAVIAQAARDGGADVLVVNGDSVLASGPAVPPVPEHAVIEEADPPDRVTFEQVAARMSQGAREEMQRMIDSGEIDGDRLAAEVERLAADPPELLNGSGVSTQRLFSAEYMPVYGRDPDAAQWDGATRSFVVLFSDKGVAHGEFGKSPGNVVAKDKRGRDKLLCVYRYKERFRLPSNMFVAGMTHGELSDWERRFRAGERAGWPTWPVDYVGNKEAEDG